MLGNVGIVQDPYAIFKENPEIEGISIGLAPFGKTLAFQRRLTDAFAMVTRPTGISSLDIVKAFQEQRNASWCSVEDPGRQNSPKCSCVPAVHIIGVQYLHEQSHGK